jgi:type VI protein secretion system component Hcp
MIRVRIGLRPENANENLLIIKFADVIIVVMEYTIEDCGDRLSLHIVKLVILTIRSRVLDNI